MSIDSLLEIGEVYHGGFVIGVLAKEKELCDGVGLHVQISSASVWIWISVFAVWQNSLSPGRHRRGRIVRCRRLQLR
jgi:hypothetical protein